MCLNVFLNSTNIFTRGKRSWEKIPQSRDCNTKSTIPKTYKSAPRNHSLSIECRAQRSNISSLLEYISHIRWGLIRQGTI